MSDSAAIFASCDSTCQRLWRAAAAFASPAPLSGVAGVAGLAPRAAAAAAAQLAARGVAPGRLRAAERHVAQTADRRAAALWLAARCRRAEAHYGAPGGAREVARLRALRPALCDALLQDDAAAGAALAAALCAAPCVQLVLTQAERRAFFAREAAREAACGSVAWRAALYGHASMRYVDKQYKDAAALGDELLAELEAARGARETPADATLRLNVLRLRAMVHERIGKFDEAIVQLKAILAERVALFGTAHMDTMRDEDRLCEALADRNDFDTAMAHFEALLAKQHALLGADHPNALATRYKKARLLLQMERPDEAVAIFRHVFERRCAVLGDEQPDTLWAQHHVAFALERLECWEEAADIYRALVAVQSRTLGPSHVDTLWTRHGLASMIEATGDYPQALTMIEEVLDELKSELGDDHVDFLTAAGNAATMMERNGELDRAIRLLNSIVDTQRRVLNDDHIEVAYTKHDLALALHSKGEFRAAIDLATEALAVRRKALGAHHPLTLLTLGGLGCSLECSGEFERAEAIYREILPHRVAALGETNQRTLWVRVRLASSRWGRTHDNAAAIDQLGELIEHLHACAGQDSTALLHECLQKTVFLLSDMGSGGGAAGRAALLGAHYAGRRRVRPETHRRASNVRMQWAQALLGEEQYAAAESHFAALAAGTTLDVSSQEAARLRAQATIGLCEARARNPANWHRRELMFRALGTLKMGVDALDNAGGGDNDDDDDEQGVIHFDPFTPIESRDSIRAAAVAVLLDAHRHAERAAAVHAKLLDVVIGLRAADLPVLLVLEIAKYAIGRADQAYVPPFDVQWRIAKHCRFFAPRPEPQ